MNIILSPSKTLDFETPATIAQFSQPAYLQQSEVLIDVLKHKSPQDIAQLMKVSDKIAALNAVRFDEWSLPFSLDNAKQCLFAFKGDVYDGLDAQSLSAEDIEFAQQHLRILSGLYGLLKPLDLIQPYRLEMGTKLANSEGKNLYEFWGNKLNEDLNHELDGQPLVNLASNEYSKAAKLKSITSNVITPVFKDEKNGQYKIISFYAKKARGLMAAYIVKNRLTDVASLQSFTEAGYYFSEAQSSASELVFLRDHA